MLILIIAEDLGVRVEAAVGVVTGNLLLPHQSFIPCITHYFKKPIMRHKPGRKR